MKYIFEAQYPKKSLEILGVNLEKMVEINLGWKPKYIITS